MSAIYGNWERLVAAVLKKEQLWQLFHSDSVSTSISSDSSGFSFCHLTSSLDEVPFCFSDLEWYASDDFGYPPPKSILSTSKNENSRKRDLKVEVPESQAKQPSYPLPLPPVAKSAAESRAENVESPWKKGKLLGKGPLGEVYIGFNRHIMKCLQKNGTKEVLVIGFIHLLKLYLDFMVGSEQGRMCAMKEVPLYAGEKGPSALIKENEIVLLSRMNHPNIVRYYGSEMVANKLYIYYEYMSRGSIHMILEQYGRLGESAIRNYTLQILSGLAYLHSKTSTHRNIKSASILIDPKGRIKLTNFGIEKQIAEKLHTSWMMDSPYWTAPEVIINPDVRSLAVDIWSLGCTILEMATSKPPLSQYDGATAMFRVAYHKELPAIPPHLSADCKDFLRQCLQWNPLHRATASQLLEHPFVKVSSPSEEKVANSLNTQCSDHARDVRRLDSGKVVSSSSNASRFLSSPLLLPSHRLPLTPRCILNPTSPLYHPISPQHTTSTSPTANGAIQLPHLNQSMIHHESFRGFPKQSPNSNSPTYWDPNIL